MLYRVFVLVSRGVEQNVGARREQSKLRSNNRVAVREFLGCCGLRQVVGLGIVQCQYQSSAALVHAIRENRDGDCGFCSECNALWSLAGRLTRCLSRPSTRHLRKAEDHETQETRGNSFYALAPLCDFTQRLYNLGNSFQRFTQRIDFLV